MARGKAIQVKIATAKVIKALETKLAQLEKDYTSQEANEAKFQKKQEAIIDEPKKRRKNDPAPARPDSSQAD